MIFSDLQQLPADPLLGIITKYRRDTNPHKIDLGVGVYRTEEGDTPVLRAVKRAEDMILTEENSKEYVGAFGNLDYGRHMTELVFGEQASQITSRLAHIQTPGGCGALRLIAELCMRTEARTVWVSDPTWVNHVPLLGSAGLSLQTYPYYDFEHAGIRFEAMREAIAGASTGDIVLLHGCCHNPSGADLTQAQWREIIAICGEKGLVPFIDIAYQGLGDSLEDDAYGLRLAASTLPEVLVSVSCSKNFALYRERVGSAFVLCQTQEKAGAVGTHLASIAREIYSMPPSHGASVVAAILESADLTEDWHTELTEMRQRLQQVRTVLASALSQKLGTGRFDFIAKDKGLFSFLGISEAQVQILAEESSSTNVEYFVDALACVLPKNL